MENILSDKRRQRLNQLARAIVYNDGIIYVMHQMNMSNAVMWNDSHNLHDLAVVTQAS